MVSWAKALYYNTPRSSGTTAAAAGTFLPFPPNAAFSRTFAGCLHRGNPAGWFSLFSQSGRAEARLEVSASLRGRAGEPLLASGRTGELRGIWMPYGCCRELYRKAAG